jgi:hypothetical protein
MHQHALNTLFEESEQLPLFGFSSVVVASEIFNTFVKVMPFFSFFVAIFTHHDAFF